jgi:hypothetical protein
MSAAAAPASDGEESAESGSLDQSARSGAGEPGQGLSVEALAARIHRKLALGDATVLPVKYHRAAVNSMAQLRTALLPGSAAVSREARLYLLYAGIAVQRRMHIDAAADEVADLEVSLALLFALQILCQERSATPAPEERASPSLAHSPEKQARLDGRKRGREEEEDELAEADGPPRPARCEHSEQLENWDEQRLQELLEPAEGWQEALRPTPDSVCRACIAVGRRMGSAASMARVVGLARVFFRCSALTLVYNMLGSQPVREANRPNFLTLGSLDFLQEANDQRDERLAALVDAAESEAGQQARWPAHRAHRPLASRRAARRCCATSSSASRCLRGSSGCGARRCWGARRTAWPRSSTPPSCRRRTRRPCAGRSGAGSTTRTRRTRCARCWPASASPSPAAEAARTPSAKKTLLEGEFTCPFSKPRPPGPGTCAFPLCRTGTSG